MDPEEFFSQLFGGEKFLPFIGHISIGKDMKSAMQEHPDEDGEGGAKRVKGSKDMTAEDKAKKEEKERKEAAEVCLHSFTCCEAHTSTFLLSEPPLGKNESEN